MALVGWILSFLALFGALALRQDVPVGGSIILSNLLFALALLACPIVWQDKPLGISRKQRILTALIAVFCLPLLLLPPG
ncbi:hypothetical protein [Sphingobium mellinum]|uniref:hypothetical protein n=1 Tax=Sphingobium mellinum TaxID=1387166 RepID=UPI0030ED0FFB